MYDITVIITAYNAEKYLKESINSIIAQHFKKWKIIAVDDGSKDKTYEILKNFSNTLKDQISIIKNDNNLGINISLNKALKQVSTPFFTRQDADDISLSNRLEILINSLKNNPDYYFVSSKMQSISDKNLTYPLKLIPYPKKCEFIASLPFCNAPTLFKSEILNKIKFNTSNLYKKRFEDYEFFFQCYVNNYFGYNITKITYLVRQDLDYYRKIKTKQRVIEFFLKYRIYKEFKNNIKDAKYLLIAFIKIFIPSILVRIIIKNIYKY